MERTRYIRSVEEGSCRLPSIRYKAPSRVQERQIRVPLVDMSRAARRRQASVFPFWYTRVKKKAELDAKHLAGSWKGRFVCRVVIYLSSNVKLGVSVRIWSV